MELICIKAIFRSDLQQIAARALCNRHGVTCKVILSLGQYTNMVLLSTGTVMYVSHKMECRQKKVDISQLNRV